GNLGQIRVERGVGFANRPSNTPAEKIQKNRTGPILRSVTDCGVEHVALSFHPRPRHRIRRPLVGLSAHAFRIERENYVQIGSEIFQRIPLLVKAEGRGYAFEAWKFRVIDDDVCILQAWRAAVGDEFSAEHAKIRIGFFSVRYVTVRTTLRVWLRMERVTGSVISDETKAVVNRAEQCLLTLR